MSVLLYDLHEVGCGFGRRDLHFQFKLVDVHNLRITLYLGVNIQPTELLPKRLLRKLCEVCRMGTQRCFQRQRPSSRVVDPDVDTIPVSSGS
jgi:hypothetical protein